MNPQSLAAIAAAVGGRLHVPAGASCIGDHVVDSVAIDSRAVVPGSLFAALRGAHQDGHEHAEAALLAGARGVLADRELSVPAVLVDDVTAALARLARHQRGLLAPGVAVVGLTGSSGKTSTKDLLAQLLEGIGPTVAPEGSFNNEIGMPLTLLRTGPDTAAVVLEMGARGPGHIAALCAVAAPTVGLVLNVGHAHVGEFGDVDTTARSKGELPASVLGGLVVLNADDARVAAMQAGAGSTVLTFGSSQGAAVRASDVRSERGRASFTLSYAGHAAPVRLRVFGAHQVSNATAAAAVGLGLGLPLELVAEALSAAVARSRWRMDVQQRADGVTVVNDAYNANPESTAAALRALVDLSEGGTRRTWAVLGQMAELGAASTELHEEVGRLAAQLAVSRLVVVGQEACGIHAGAVSAATVTAAELVPDAAGATRALSGSVLPGDVVLVKGSRVAGLEVVADALLAGHA